MLNTINEIGIKVQKGLKIIASPFKGQRRNEDIVGMEDILKGIIRTRIAMLK